MCGSLIYEVTCSGDNYYISANYGRYVINVFCKFESLVNEDP